MRVVGPAAVDPSRVAWLADRVAAFRLTEHVLRGLPALDATFVDVVDQDEFTLDLLVRLPDDLFLVFDTT